MNGWLWILLGLAFFFWALRTGREGLGKVITFPMAKYILQKQVEKTHKKTDAGSLTIKDVRRTLWIFKHVVHTPSKFRFWQLTAAFVVWIPISVVIDWRGQPDPYVVFWIVLYADDVLTGDIDKWKKKWKSLRNRVKWRMVLPKTASQQS